MVGMPRKTASLDQAGVEKVLEMTRKDSAFAHLVADELEANPRAVLMKLFRLSTRQTEAIAATSDRVLLIRALPLIERLRSGNLEGIKYNPGCMPEEKPVPGEAEDLISVHIPICTCHF
jgi:hypothetical protein